MTAEPGEARLPRSISGKVFCEEPLWMDGWTVLGVLVLVLLAVRIKKVSKK